MDSLPLDQVVNNLSEGPASIRTSAEAKVPVPQKFLQVSLIWSREKTRLDVDRAGQRHLYPC